MAITLIYLIIFLRFVFIYTNSHSKGLPSSLNLTAYYWYTWLIHIPKNDNFV